MGRTPSRSRRSTTIAPQISVPCVRAHTIACGPGLPLSKVWTHSTPVEERRWGSMSGASSSIRMALMGGSVVVSFGGGVGAVLVVRMRVVVVVRVRMRMGMVVRMVRVIVVVVVTVIVVVRPAGVGAALGIARHGVEQAREVPLQRVEPGGLRAARLVHVQATVDLDLQAVAPAPRVRECADQLDALVRIVHLHLVAHAAQALGDERRELALARRSIAIPE